MKTWLLVAAMLAPQVAWAGPSAWCKQKTEASEYDLPKLKSHDMANDAMIELIGELSCSPDSGVEAHRRDVDAARAEWSKKLGMSDADWADVAPFAEARQGEFLKADFSVKGFDKMTPIDQYKAIRESFQDSSGDVTDALYVADVLDARLSETGRMAFIRWCLEDSTGGVHDNVVRWAICQPDIDKFDANKIFAEVKSDTAHGGAARMWLRIKAYEVAGDLKEYAKKKAAALKQDGEYAKVFDTAVKARAEWAKTVGSNSKLLEVALGVDSGVLFHSRKLLDGCEQKTQDMLAAEIAKLPAGTFQGMMDVRDDPYAGFAGKAGPKLVANPSIHLAASAFLMCEPKNPSADFLGGFLEWLPGARGPRSFAIGEIATASASFKFDDTSAGKLAFPQFNERPYMRSGGKPDSAGGTVKSVKKDKDVLVVSLEKTFVNGEICSKSHRGRADRIVIETATSARVEYESICDKWEPHKFDTTWSDFKIDPKFEKLLKPGVVFSSTYGGGEKADVIAIWPSKTAKTPSWVLGATLKP